MNPLALLPELLVLTGAVAGLVTGLFVPRDRQRVVAWINAIALAGAVAALGAILMAGTADLLVLVAAYLPASIPAYALAGFAKDAPGTEAALKYYLMGAFLGICLLAGVTLAYGSSGATAYGQVRAPAVAAVLLLGGLLFKAGGVPAHFWVPDVAEGASRPVAVFAAKVLMFAAAWDGGLAWLAVVAAVNTVASVFYYLRWIRPVFAGAAEGPPPVGRGAVALVAAAASLLLGVAAGAALLAA
ncbi:hypothetical protein E1286_47180 [Nonomuraea terrae]|uniref:NADH:quinone oxidoreductase/Mrp antiporter transmembrane domain-containing protein n=1 Tax=Nonomuraea terrae TaxID=2530383 RepID=A0A4R4XAS3_9ACTN|nr:proton-conducting transporter membrane subunit [Nonomuraea terrae]TDD27634.1 hypothetical protein E1286_47180 [Nonomuraea terrae]